MVPLGKQQEILRDLSTSSPEELSGDCLETIYESGAVVITNEKPACWKWADGWWAWARLRSRRIPHPTDEDLSMGPRALGRPPDSECLGLFPSTGSAMEPPATDARCGEHYLVAG